MSSRGIATIDLAPGMRVAAPRSGLLLGTGVSGPVVLRLFRPTGTRVAAVSALLPVQLLVLRAAAGGVQVRVRTARPRQWQPLLARGTDAAAVGVTSDLPAPAGPSLVVDDRPEETRRLGETVPWRCRIDIRSPASSGDLRTLIGADVLLVGELLPDLALAATSGMGVSAPNLAQLTSPVTGTVAVLRRGGLDHVTLDPSAEERQLLVEAG